MVAAAVIRINIAMMGAPNGEDSREDWIGRALLPCTLSLTDIFFQPGP